MSFVENLDRDDWPAFMRRILGFTLEVLRTDRFGHVGSAADDLRTWLTVGGVPEARRNLDEQLRKLRFEDDRRAAVLAELARLATEHQPQLLELFALGVIPTPSTTDPAEIALSPEFIQILLQRMQAGERPFDDWMRAMGRPEEDIARVYAFIDRSLLKSGLVAPTTSRADEDVH